MDIFQAPKVTSSYEWGSMGTLRPLIGFFIRKDYV